MNEIRVIVRQRKTVMARIPKLGSLEEPDIEIVARVDNILELLVAAKQYKADVVVTTDNPEDRGMASHLLSEFPDITLMMLGNDGGVLIEQRCSVLRRVSAEHKNRIAETLRYAVHRPCERKEPWGK